MKLAVKCTGYVVDDVTSTSANGFCFKSCQKTVRVRVGRFRKLFWGGGAARFSKPDPISDQNILFFIPLFRPDPESVSRDWLPFAYYTYPDASMKRGL